MSNHDMKDLFKALYKEGIRYITRDGWKGRPTQAIDLWNDKPEQNTEQGYFTGYKHAQGKLYVNNIVKRFSPDTYYHIDENGDVIAIINPELSSFEKQYLRYCQDNGCNYIAKDSDGKTYVFGEKPTYDSLFEAYFSTFSDTHTEHTLGGLFETLKKGECYEIATLLK